MKFKAGCVLQRQSSELNTERTDQDGEGEGGGGRDAAGSSIT